MMLRNKRIAGLLSVILFLALTGCRQRELEISNGQLEIGWNKSAKGWEVNRVKIRAGEKWKDVGIPSGEYTYLYTAQKPDSTLTVFKAATGVVFPEPIYRYQKRGWAEATNPVALNTA